MKKIIIILLALMGCTSEPSAVDSYIETVDQYRKTVNDYKKECDELSRIKTIVAWHMHANGWVQGYTRALQDQIRMQETGIVSTAQHRAKLYKLDSIETATIKTKF